MFFLKLPAHLPQTLSDVFEEAPMEFLPSVLGDLARQHRRLRLLHLCELVQALQHSLPVLFSIDHREDVNASPGPPKPIVPRRRVARLRLWRIARGHHELVHFPLGGEDEVAGPQDMALHRLHRPASPGRRRNPDCQPILHQLVPAHLAQGSTRPDRRAL